MKKLILAVIGVMAMGAVSAQAWNWAVSGGGRSNSEGNTSIAKDAAGNTYLCGDFEGSKNFGTTPFTAVGFADGFLVKYNAQGVFQWAVQFSGNGFVNSVEGSGVAVDAAGDVIVSMNFSSSLNAGGNTYFNPGGNNDAILIKYTSAGIFSWARQVGGAGNERITRLCYYNNALYACGSHTQAFTAGSVSFAAPSSGSLDDAFLLKCDAAGVPLWGVKGGSSLDDRALALDAGPGGIYYGGYFTGTANFGGTSVVSGSVQGQSQPDWFLVKLDESGAQQWVKDYGGAYGEQVFGISQNAFGSVYCIGNFYGSSTFGTGLTLTEFSPGNPAGNGDVFVCLIDATTGTCNWVRHIRCVNGNNNETGESVSCDPGGSAYVTGAFNGNSTIAGAANQTGTTLSATSNPGKDAFVAKYSITGSLLWAIKLGGTNVDVGKSILWNPNGFCTVAGNFSASITVTSSISITAASASASYFLANYNGLTASTDELSADAFSMYPNPTDGMLRISTRNLLTIDRVEVYSVTGQLLLSEQIGMPGDDLRLNLASLDAGSYLVRLITDQGVGTQKIQVY